MKWLSAVVITAILGSASAFAAPAKAVPPDLQKAADCMYDILKKEPGFAKAKLGVFESDGYSLPYLQYLSPADKQGRRITVSFGAQVACTTVKRSYNCCTDKGRFCFLALLSGIFAAPELGPPGGDVQVIAEKWNAQCNVVAMAIFV
jgi:hypothetical protein